MNETVASALESLDIEPSLKELSWSLIRNKLTEQAQVKIEDADVKNAAREAARAQFAQYGMNNVPEDEDIDFVVKVTHLPFKPQMAYIVGACTDEQLKASKELWEKEWTQTPFGKAITATQASVSDLPVNSQQPQENQTEAENDETEQQQHI